MGRLKLPITLDIPLTTFNLASGKETRVFMNGFDVAGLTLQLQNYFQSAYGLGAGVAAGAIFFMKLGVLLALTAGIIYLAVIFLIE